MKTILCIFLSSILITLVYILKNYLLEEKIKIKDLLKYYLKATILINIVMIFFVKLKYNVFIWEYSITLSFLIKYLLIGNVVGLFLPTFYYYLRTLKNNIINTNKEYKIFSYVNLKRMLTENKSVVQKVLFFITHHLERG